MDESRSTSDLVFAFVPNPLDDAEDGEKILLLSYKDDVMDEGVLSDGFDDDSTYDDLAKLDELDCIELQECEYEFPIYNEEKIRKFLLKKGLTESQELYDLAVEEFEDEEDD